MDFFFNPRGIALVGATANTNKVGFSILKNLSASFKGEIYPVNPRYSDIDGFKCYASVTEVPDPVDLAIVFVPAPMVPRIIRECAQRGIPGAMIQSAGFAEVGEKGKALQDELTEIARLTGIRIWGPNCMGLVDAIHGKVFSFVSPAIWDEGLTGGSVSLVVQSGMLSAGFLIDLMTHGKMGISKACSIGNKADVDECDILEYLIEDPHTGAIALYLESIPEGRRFLDICTRSGKPIVALKGGRSLKGAQAAMSHTASLAGDREVVSGALAQAGVVEAADFGQMMDLARTLAMYPRVPGQGKSRIAVLTFSGAAGIVSTDLMDQEGLELADLSGDTIERLREIFPSWMPVSNPIDLWPAIEKSGSERAYREAVRAVCADPGVHALFLHVFVGGVTRHVDISTIVETARDARKPLFCWLIGKREETREFQMQAHELGMPVFREICRAVECMAAVLHGGKLRPQA